MPSKQPGKNGCDYDIEDRVSHRQTTLSKERPCDHLQDIRDDGNQPSPPMLSRPDDFEKVKHPYKNLSKHTTRGRV